MQDSLIEELGRLALAHRILEMEGHGDMTQGHLSLRDPQGRGFWLKRHGIGLGEVMSHDDFILLDLDTGKRLAGSGQRHSEWPIHSEILRARPEITVVAHTHPFHAGIFSATSEELVPLTLDGSRFATRVPHHKDTAELVNTVELGRGLATALGAAYAIFMLNHGITFVGRTVEQALLMGVSLERACQAQLAAAASGLKMEWPNQEDMARRRRSGTGNETHAPQGFYQQTFEYYARKLAWAERTGPMPGYFKL